MNLMIMDEKQKKLMKYFTGPHRKGSVEFKSPYIAALIDARLATGRNKKTGKKLKKSHGSWVGTLGYMALLDHLGKIIRPKETKRNYTGKNNFIRALMVFTDLKNVEIDSLYALRCSFAHDYSLYNIPDNKKDSLVHLFKVKQGEGGELVVFPKKTWSEDFNDISETVINIELLGDLVERIHKNIIKGIHSNEVEFLSNANILYISYPI